ncbi:MAG: hypothetical protein Q9227_002540 [Pyrenula ochraceoflavens]
MSFGFGSGGGGFGANQNQSSGSTFGGFGGTNNTSTGGGFGSTANTGNSLFGNKTGFGTSSGGSLFGNTATSSAPSGSGFGGFSNSSTSGGFGSTNTNNTGGLFGNKPASGFGSSTTNTSSAFGGGFGATTSGGFGSGTALGGNVPPSNGTADIPFNAYTEKESGNSNINNHFQTITMMQPYQKYSQEELRLADYEKGRRYGSAGGGFGQASGFGGFGATNTGTSFGGQNNAFGGSSGSTGFGQSSTTGAGGFGTNTGGGIFGQQKPASTGLFGQQSSGTSSGGLFGTSGSNTGGFGGFGSNNTSSNNQSGGLFGQNAQKPGGLFGNTANTNTGGSNLFGQNQSSNTTGGGLFGSSNNASNTTGSGGLFGQQNNAQSSGGAFGGFGQQNQSQQNKPGSLFGSLNTSTSQPSGGLFGSNNTSNTSSGGGLFGSNNNNQQNTGGGLFGNTNTNQSKGLFGSSTTDTQKPGGLFGSNTSNTNTGFGGFGNTQNQGQGSGGLFGSAQNTNQQSGGLFGNTANNTGGSNLFGSSQKPAGSLFGGNTQSQPQNNSLFGSQNNSSSLFGTPQNQQNPQQQGAMHSSLLEGNPYGQSSIWSGLPPATAQNSGPLVTPLSASQRLKERQAQPAFKFTPLASSKFMTPPKRTGYGFSYSTYGSPSSASSTPGGGSLTSSMYGKQFSGGSFGRSMGKSFSASNLRQQYSADGDSVLAPGAFSPSSSRYSSGSIRRLTIDRNLRTESLLTPRALPAPPPATNGNTNGVVNGLESAPPTAHKDRRVSFAGDTTGGEDDITLNGTDGALVRTGTDSSTPEDSSNRNGVNGTANADQNRGKELAAVPEDQEPDSIASRMRLPQDAPAGPDQKEGEYYMIPARGELRKLPREQLQHFNGFRVGRQGCGEIRFDQEVDLTSVPLDDLWDKVVVIHIRSITVYPDSSTKPPVGKGLNVPSTISMENSWPRNRHKPSPATSGPGYERHIRRLKRLTNCNFISYDNQTGVWTFSVPHYTTYDLEYDDDDEEEDLDSPLSSAPNTSALGAVPTDSTMDVDEEEESNLEDDTFGYKKSLPGTFGRRSDYHQQDAFLGEGSAAGDASSVVSEDAMDMAGSFPTETRPVEPTPTKYDNMMATVDGRHLLDLDGDWADQLRRTISPRKQDRQALREAQGKILVDRDFSQTQKSNVKNDFRTSIDVMNSLFGKHEERRQASRKQNTSGTEFEWPYSKRPKTFHAAAEQVNPADAERPPMDTLRWTSTNNLLLSRGQVTRPHGAQSWDWSDKPFLTDPEGTISKASLQCDDEEYKQFLESWQHTDISLTNGIPTAQLKKLPFMSYMAQFRAQAKTNTPILDARIYGMARILFDDYEDHWTVGLTAEQRKQYRHRIVKDRFTELWKLLIQERQMLERRGPHEKEERAIDLLTINDIKGACNVLMQSRDLHLATLVAQLGRSSPAFKNSMKEQLEAWTNQRITAEMTDPIRALYTILSGNTSIVEGNTSSASTAPEDRASTFSISERFDLNWMQVFGLYLWYGISEDDPIDVAILNYARKLSTGEESAVPDADQRTVAGTESPYWTILKLYALSHSSGNDGIDLGEDATPVLPQTLAPLAPPFDVRFVFQLHHALAAHLPSTIQIDTTRADQLASEFSFQLAAAGYFVGALFPLLYLSDSAARERAVKQHLSVWAARLPTPNSGTPTGSPGVDLAASWKTITQVLRIPGAWVLSAKAEYARSIGRSDSELVFYIGGHLWAHVHECLVKRVGPRAVVDGDEEVVKNIGSVVERYGEKMKSAVRIEEWEVGGGMLGDYAALVKDGNDEGKKDGERLMRCMKALGELERRRKATLSARSSGGQRQRQQQQQRERDLLAGGVEELEQMVALKEMGKRVAGWAVKAFAAQQNVSLSF